jgi:mitochondrial import inner membrane translocase subunit TIM50
MQNLLRSKLFIKSRKLSNIKSSNFSSSLVKNKNNFKRNFVVLQKERQGYILIKYTKMNFSAKQEGEKTEKTEQSKEEQQNQENKENQENQQEETTQEEQPEYKTSRRIRFAIGKIIKYMFILGGILTFYNAHLYRKKDKPEEHTGFVKPLNKLVKKIHYFWFLTYGSLTLPYYEKILPDALELQGQPPKKTLVVNLNKTLINYEYKFGSGFEILKRPGLLKFLQEMGQNYELVIFGTEDSNFVEEVCGKLDQFDMNIKYKLGKEAVRLVNGHYVKDLEFLNRDLRNVVCIDYNPDNVAFNPHNVVVIPEFNGDGKDRELLQSIVFLKELAKPEVRDVRKELEKYGHYRPYIKFYKSDPKYKKLLPKNETETVLDDMDLQAVRNKK